MTITGKIVKVLPLASGVSQKGTAWQKQEYLLETEERYPRQICFEVMNDNIAKFGIQVGQKLSVDVDLSSREYNGRYYTSVAAWKVQTLA